MGSSDFCCDVECAVDEAAVCAHEREFVGEAGVGVFVGGVANERESFVFAEGDVVFGEFEVGDPGSELGHLGLGGSEVHLDLGG